MENDEYRRGYLCGMIRGDAHIGTSKSTASGASMAKSHRFQPRFVRSGSASAIAGLLARLRSRDARVPFSGGLRHADAQCMRFERHSIAKVDAIPAADCIGRQTIEGMVGRFPGGNLRCGRQLQPDGFQNSKHGSRDHRLDPRMLETFSASLFVVEHIALRRSKAHRRRAVEGRPSRSTSFFPHRSPGDHTQTRHRRASDQG